MSDPPGHIVLFSKVQQGGPAYLQPDEETQEYKNAIKEYRKYHKISEEINRRGRSISSLEIEGKIGGLIKLPKAKKEEPASNYGGRNNGQLCPKCFAQFLTKRV